MDGPLSRARCSGSPGSQFQSASVARQDAFLLIAGHSEDGFMIPSYDLRNEAVLGPNNGVVRKTSRNCDLFCPARPALDFRVTAHNCLPICVSIFRGCHVQCVVWRFHCRNCGSYTLLISGGVLLYPAFLFI